MDPTLPTKFHPQIWNELRKPITRRWTGSSPNRFDLTLKWVHESSAMWCSMFFTVPHLLRNGILAARQVNEGPWKCIEYIYIYIDARGLRASVPTWSTVFWMGDIRLLDELVCDTVWKYGTLFHPDYHWPLRAPYWDKYSRLQRPGFLLQGGDMFRPEHPGGGRQWRATLAWIVEYASLQCLHFCLVLGCFGIGYCVDVGRPMSLNRPTRCIFGYTFMSLVIWPVVVGSTWLTPFDHCTFQRQDLFPLVT